MNDAIKRISRLLSIISGFTFLIIAIFISVNTISRYLGGPYSGLSDLLSSMAMALGGAWSLSYALVNDTHVKVDLFNLKYPKKINDLFKLINLSILSFLTIVLFKESFALALNSYELGALIPQSMVDLPLALPQFLASFGFFIFMVQSIFMTLSVALNMRSKGEL